MWTRRFLRLAVAICAGAITGMLAAAGGPAAVADTEFDLVAFNASGRVRTFNVNGVLDLAKQADAATMGHAQASLHITPQEAEAIVAFETGLFTAQVGDNQAGSLTADGALGGPRALSRQPFFIGINDPVGLNPTGAPFDPNAFTIFNAWAGRALQHDDTYRARRAIWRRSCARCNPVAGGWQPEKSRQQMFDVLQEAP